MKSFRVDSGNIISFKRTPQGYVKLKLRCTRTGVFRYMRDGKISYELRHPNDLFSADTLSTFETSVFTNDHPKKDGEFILLDSSNTKKFQAGHAVGKPEVSDRKFIDINVLVTDEETVKAVESGKREVSIGSTSDIEKSSGKWNGEAYNKIHKNIIINHIALVDKGRAGPDVKILSLDSAVEDAVDRGNNMLIKVGDKEFDVDESLAEAIKKESQKSIDQLDNLRTQIRASSVDHDTLQAQLDSYKAENIKLKEGAGESTDKEVIREMVKEIAQTYINGSMIISQEKMKSIDGVDPIDIKKKVLLAHSPDFSLDGKSDDYISARFDFVLESQKTDNTKTKPKEQSNDSLGSALFSRYMSSDDNSSDISKLSRVEEARKKAIERDANRWKDLKN